MPSIILRNPPGRWGFWLAWAVIIFVAIATLLIPEMRGCADSYGAPCEPPAYLTLLLWTSPPWLGFLLAAYYSFRARVVIDENGIRIRQFMGNKFHPWANVREMRLRLVRRYTNGVRSGTERTMELLVEGKHWRELPAPKAGFLVGRREYEEQTAKAWQVYQYYRSRQATAR